MKRKNTITIRTNLGFAIYSFIVAIFLLCLMLYFKDIIYLIVSMYFVCISFLSYSFKITLDLSQLDNNILIINRDHKTYTFNVKDLEFTIIINILILNDTNLTLNLENNYKLIRELKKLGATEKELEWVLFLH